MAYATRGQTDTPTKVTRYLTHVACAQGRLITSFQAESSINVEHVSADHRRTHIQTQETCVEYVEALLKKGQPAQLAPTAAPL